MPSTLPSARAVPDGSQPCRERRLLRLSWAFFALALIGALALLLQSQPY